MPKKADDADVVVEEEAPKGEHRTAYDHARESSPADALHPHNEG